MAMMGKGNMLANKPAGQSAMANESMPATGQKQAPGKPVSDKMRPVGKAEPLTANSGAKPPKQANMAVTKPAATGHFMQKSGGSAGRGHMGDWADKMHPMGK